MDVALLLAIDVPELARAAASRRDSNANWLEQAALRAIAVDEAVAPRHTHILPNPQILPVSTGNASR